jgi:hypothetical protein
LAFVVALVVAGSLTATLIAIDRSRSPSAGPALCTVVDGTVTYALTPEQVANAATISAVASKLGLADHAVTVGLATALQESKLRNLDYGDRDSLGLFQQRPSQGWGTPDEIIQPTYAATVFYGALQKVPDWENLDVSVAAQKVQRSADGSAYAPWEGEARALAVALTGQKAAGLACSGGTVTYSHTATAVTAATTTALGANGFTEGGATALGWRTASYLVANAQAFGVSKVSYAGQTWTAHRGTWESDPAATGVVTFTVAPAPSPARS